MDKPLRVPLHVQVAEALGWTEVGRHHPAYDPPLWVGTTPDGKTWLLAIPLYDTDWRATGPLIEKYGFWIRHLDGEVAEWDAFRNDDLPNPQGTGSTPLIAVCRLILRLAEAGKLDHGGK